MSDGPDVRLVPLHDAAKRPAANSEWDDWGGPVVNGTEPLGRMLVDRKSVV